MFGHDILVRPATLRLNRATRARLSAITDFEETPSLCKNASATIRRAAKDRLRRAGRRAGKALCRIGVVDHDFVPEYDHYADDNVFDFYVGDYCDGDDSIAGLWSVPASLAPDPSAP